MLSSSSHSNPHPRLRSSTNVNVIHIRFQQQINDRVHQVHLGLKVEAVRKILSYSLIAGSGRTATGIAHVDGHDIPIIDLHQRIFQTEIGNPDYILLLKPLKVGQVPIGILVEDTPIMVEIPAENIRLLPEGYRQLDTLWMADQVAQVEIEGKALTLFLLDAQRFTLT